MRHYDGSNPARSIVNAQSKCTGSVTQDLHSNMMEGKWDHDLTCPDGGKIVGVHVYGSSVYHKLLNFQAQCAWNIE